MYCDWTDLPETLQMEIADQALRHAAQKLASQAELLAREMEHGFVPDRGGPDALRLLAALLQNSAADVVCGHA